LKSVDQLGQVLENAELSDLNLGRWFQLCCVFRIFYLHFFRGCLRREVDEDGKSDKAESQGWISVLLAS